MSNVSMIDGHIDESRMTDNEIIKAEEIISKLHKYCYFAHMKVGEFDTFNESDFEFLHNFINRQKTEIERLKPFEKKVLNTLTENLKQLEYEKAEAIKEFAERFDKWLGYYEVLCIEQQNWCARDVTREIKQHLEEMVGDNSGKKENQINRYNRLLPTLYF